MASQCYMAGRIEAAVGYSEAGQTVSAVAAARCRSASRACLAVHTCTSASPNGLSSGAAPNSRAVVTPTHSPRAALVIALKIAGSDDEAMAAANGLIDAAEATGNPWALSFALFAYGFAFLDADPVRALEALRRGLVIAQDSGNRAIEYIPGVPSCADLRPNTATRWPRSITSPWRSATHHDSGNTTMIRAALAILAAFFDRLGRYEPPRPSADSPSQALSRSPRLAESHRDSPPSQSPR